MDFQLTTEQEAVRKAARELALKVFTPVAAKYDREETYPFEEWKIFAQQGWLGCGSRTSTVARSNAQARYFARDAMRTC